VNPWKRKEVIGNATLYLGDCLEILPTLPKVDAVITDPPYGLNFPYLSFNDTRENLAALVNRFMPAASGVAVRVVVLPGITQVALYPNADWLGCVTWNTTGSFGAYGYTQWMPVLLYGPDVPGFGRTSSGETKADVIRISGGGGVGFARSDDEKSNHPCPKPENVMRRLVARYSDADVIDPFMGSGTTGVACANLGRAFIGIEIEPKYFDIACERIENAQRQERLFA
jgi:DNA modification methylase